MTHVERSAYPVRRSLAAVALAAVAALAGACVTGVDADTSAEPPRTTPTTAPTTTRPPVTTTSPSTVPTTVAPPTTAAPSTTVPVPPPVSPPPGSVGTPQAPAPAGPEPEILEAGVVGPRTAAVQEQLLALGYDGGPADGEFGTRTTMAVWAFQKVNGFAPDGRVTPELWSAMQAPAAPVPPLRPDGGGDRVEIDLARQLLFLYDGGQLVLITHISTGTGEEYCDGGVCGVAVTPTGDFTVTRRISGWRTSALGRLYNPLYFHGGIAIHGSPSVPDYPASHGCVRIPMHIAEYFPDLVTNGEPVFVV